MKAITSFFGLIPTNDIEIHGANEFMKGVIKGIASHEGLRSIRKIITEEDDSDEQADADPRFLHGVQITSQIMSKLDQNKLKQVLGNDAKFE